MKIGPVDEFQTIIVPEENFIKFYFYEQTPPDWIYSFNSSLVNSSSKSEQNLTSEEIKELNKLKLMDQQNKFDCVDHTLRKDCFTPGKLVPVIEDFWTTDKKNQIPLLRGQVGTILFPIEKKMKFLFYLQMSQFLN